MCYTTACCTAYTRALLGIIVAVSSAAYKQCGLYSELQSSHSGGVRFIENAACFLKNTVVDSVALTHTEIPGIIHSAVAIPMMQLVIIVLIWYLCSLQCAGIVFLSFM